MYQFLLQRVAFSIGIIILAIIYSASALASKTYITNLRVIRKPHHWQFVFDATAPINYKFFYLNKPERAVFVLPATHLKHMFSRGSYVDTPVTKIRAQRSNDTLRLVLDLDHSVNVSSFSLKPSKQYPNRFVVDLKGNPIKVVGIFQPTPSKKPRINPKYYLRPLMTPDSLLTRQERDVIVVIDPGHGRDRHLHESQ